MSKQDELLLAKAHGIVHHLGKMVKAVSSFNEHMSGLHKAHHDDMQQALTKLHKMVGVEPAEAKEYGDGEPKDVQPQDEGTKNLQDFGGKAAKGENLTKAEVSQLVGDAMNQFAETFLKALAGGEIESPVQQPVQKAAGVGDRTQLRQPVQQVVAKVDTSGPGVTQAPQVALTPELAKRAAEGDRDAIREFMKSVLPQEVPDTLIQPLSKIH
jgi:hypothetical protein